MIRHGFTGTRRPLPNARGLVINHLMYLDPVFDELVVGCAVGMDQIIGEVGHEMGFCVHGVLPDNRSQVASNWKDWCSSHEDMPVGTNYMQRNGRVVSISIDLTAFPIRMASVISAGGTWATVRLARKAKIPVKIIPLEV